PGQGTTVLIRLPEADPAIVAAAVAPAGAARAAGMAGEGQLAADIVPATGRRSVLVVEDDLAVREMAAETLREAGWQVSEAPDGRVALAMVAAGERFDLLFTDVVMPGGI